MLGGMECNAVTRVEASGEGEEVREVELRARFSCSRTWKCC